MEISQGGKQFIMANEGLKLAVSGDTGGKQEIGYGHDLLPGESFPDGITQIQAMLLLNADLAPVENAINALGWELTQNQYDALADFGYECGHEAVEELAAHGESQVTAQLPHWRFAHVGGVLKVLPGMVTRRAAEVELWNTP